MPEPGGYRLCGRTHTHPSHWWAENNTTYSCDGQSAKFEPTPRPTGYSGYVTDEASLLHDIRDLLKEILWESRSRSAEKSATESDLETSPEKP